MSTTYQQLQEAQNRLLDAQRREGVRLAAEIAAQKEIEQAQADIQRLAVQARQEEFERAIGSVRAAAQHALDTNQAIVDALEVGDVRAALRLGDSATQAWGAYDAQRRQALGIIEPELQAAVREALSKPGHNATPDFVRYSVYRDTLNSFEHQLPVACGFIYTIIAWIAGAPDAVERRVRQGLAYAVTGQLWNPTADYDALRAYMADQRSRQGGYIHG